MATLAPAATRDQAFWQKMMLGIALFDIVAFAQFAARGMVDLPTAPIHVHLHGLSMLGWLTLCVVQPWLVGRDNLALHRKLGWLGVVFAAALVALGLYTGVHAVATRRFPPFFEAGYFLALSQLGLIAFGGVVAAAVALRRRTDWHRRLMLGALILIMEPALGRTLPMPFIMPWGEWLSLAIRLGVLGLVMRHDRKTIGAIHPATIAVGLAMTATHVLIEALGRMPAWIALAEGLGRG